MNEQTQLSQVKSSKATEDSIQFAGLPDFWFAVPVIVWAFFVSPLGEFLLGLGSVSRLLVGTLAGAVVYFIMRHFMNGKPQHFFSFWAWERIAPMQYRPFLQRSEKRTWSWQ